MPPDFKRRRRRGIKTSKKKKKFSDVLRGLVSKVENAIVHFRVHAAAFVSVNIFLIIVNVLTSMSHPWFYYPLVGWAIGLFSHLQYVFNWKKRRDQLLSLEHLTAEQYRAVKSLQITESNFRHHRTAYLSVNAYLLGVNMITSAHFPWFIFPLAGWGVGFFLHSVFYFAKRKQLKNRLKSLGIDWQKLVKMKPPPITDQMKAEISRAEPEEYVEYLSEAEVIKNTLLADLKNQGQLKSELGLELNPLLENFVKHIGELIEKNNELNRIMNNMPHLDWEAEINNLIKKMEKTESSTLKREYQKTIKQYRKHLKSLTELNNQKELIQLRLNSSVMALKQMQIDFYRLKNLESFEESASVKQLKEKSDELSQYLDDLDKSYDELEI